MLQNIDIIYLTSSPLVTNFYSYYGCIKIENTTAYIAIGPINDFPYTKDSLLIMAREFSVENSKVEIFWEFFHKIPQQNLDPFINLLLFINYTVNGTELTRKDVEHSTGNHKVIQYVRENTNKNNTVAEVADHVGFSPPSLSR